jgi:SAM-dependent methyltransferase
MPEFVVCNLCGSEAARPLFRLRDYRFCVDDVEWTAVRCKSCGLGYLNPRPTVDEIRRYYPERYFTQRASQMDRYRRQARYVVGERGRLLDIGTARGDFLSVMAERGWQTAGIEPFATPGSSRRSDIHYCSFPEECELDDGDYDVITAWAVFEHLRDPAAAFRKAADLLREGGRLVIQVPNLHSVYSRWARQEDVPRHLYFFTPRTLHRYGEMSGLELVRVFHTTDLFGGSGRGVMRLALVRALGRSTPEFFEMWRTPRAERFRRWPLLAPAWTAVAGIESIFLNDWLVRLLRVSGQIVVEFVKPDAPPARLDLQDAA